MEMFDAFLMRAILAGVVLSLAAAPLGCFVVWRRMADFGDATAHASILGVALALAFALPVFIGVLLIALAMALAISALQARGQTLDTLLGVMAHSTLALGLVTVSFFSDVRIDLMAYLFGDILSVAWSDFLWIGLGLFLVVGLLGWRWSALLTCTLNRDLAQAEGINPKREQLVLTLALALIVALGIQVVGAILIAALLIIPAAAARNFANTPEAMALIAAAFGACATLGGLAASLHWDTPTGPSIICCAAALFFISTLLGALRGRGLS